MLFPWEQKTLYTFHDLCSLEYFKIVLGPGRDGSCVPQCTRFLSVIAPGSVVILHGNELSDGEKGSLR